MSGMDSQTVDDADVNAIEVAVDNLLDSTQGYLGYNYDTSGSTPPPKPSVELSYRFKAEIEISVNTNWDIVSGVTLTNITLTTRVDKVKNRNGRLYIDLRASATIGQTLVKVRATIPRLGKGGPVDILFHLTAHNPLDTIDSSSFVGALTGNDGLWASDTSNLDGQLQGELDLTKEGTSVAVGALLHVTRPAGAESFSISAFYLSLSSNATWTVTPSFTVTQAALAFKFERNPTTAQWQTSLSLTGDFTVQEQLSLNVRGLIELGSQNAAYFALEAKHRGSANLEPVVQQITGTSTPLATNFPLPADLQYPTGNDSTFSGAIAFLKDTSGWYLDHLDAELQLQLDTWQPVDDIDLILRSVSLGLFIDRQDLADSEQPSSAGFDWTGYGMARLVLYGHWVDATISYDSIESLVTIGFALDQENDINLVDVAAFPSFNPDNATPRDISLQSAALPEAVPIDMSWCAQANGSVDNSIVVVTSSTDIKQLVLSANFDVSWQLTSSLEITQMGIYFDIENPLALVSSTTISAYAYGTMTVGQSIEVYAFVSAETDPTQSTFQVYLSATYEPGAALNLSPQTVFGTTALGVSAIDISAGSWSLPDSFPTGSVPATVTSANAFMTLQVQQTPSVPPNSSWTTAITQVTAYAGVIGTWTICSGLTLTKLEAYVSATPATSTSPIAFSVMLSGQLDAELTTVGNTAFTVYLRASFVNSPSAPTQFAATAAIAPNSSTPTLQTLLNMPFTGISSSALQAASGTVPTDYPASSSELLQSAAVSASLIFTEQQSVWQLTRISAVLQLIGQPWTIIPNVLQLSSASLKLDIVNPRSGSPQITFSGQATLTILVGTQQQDVTVQTALSQDLITLTVQSGSLQNIMSNMVGQGFVIPQDCPVLDQGFTFALIFTCSKDSNTGQWSLANTQLQITASASAVWQLGQLKISNITFAATYSLPNAAGAGARQLSTSLTGTVMIGNFETTLLLTYSTPPNATSPQIDALITVTSPTDPTKFVDPSNLVAAFVTGGLGSSGPFETPSITSDSGASGYQSSLAASAEALFSRQSGSWQPDWIKCTININKPWRLNNNLTFTISSLTVEVMNPSNSPQLIVELDSSLSYKPRPGGSSSPDLSYLYPKLLATNSYLQFSVDISGCSLAQFLYSATDGFWNPPDALALPLPQDSTITIILNWDIKVATFTATCATWTLTDKVPTLAALASPKLVVTVTKGGGGLSAAGQLSGEAVVLGVEVPVSFDLATGPLCVGGIDVKQAYKLAQKLYNLLKDAERVAQICSEMAEFAEVLGTAGEVLAGLLGLGVASDIASNAVNKAYGSQSTNSNPPATDPTQPADSGQPHNVIQLAGSLLTSGPAGQQASLMVFPIDSNGLVPSQIQASQVSLIAGPPLSGAPAITGLTWNPIPSGMATVLPRPSADTGTLGVTFQLPDSSLLQASFTNSVQPQLGSIDISKSTVQSPATAQMLQIFYIQITPFDQYGAPIFGIADISPLSIAISSVGGEAVSPAPTITAYPNSIVAQCSLPSIGNFEVKIVTVSSGIVPSQTRSFAITATDGLVVERCTAFGPGLSTGKPGENTQFTIDLRSATGPYMVTDSNTPLLSVSLQDLNTTNPSVIPLSATFSGSQAIVQYQRPATATDYNITVMIGTSLVSGGPFAVKCNPSGTFVSTVNSVASMSIPNVKSGPIPSGVLISVAQGDMINIQVTAYDNLGMRYLQKVSSLAVYPDAAASSSLSSWLITQYDDGTVLYSIPAQQNTATVSIDVHQQGDTAGTVALGSPWYLQIGGARQFQSVQMYGPGLTGLPGPTAAIYTTGMDQYGANFSPIPSTTTFQVITNLGDEIDTVPIATNGVPGLLFSLDDIVNQVTIVELQSNTVTDAWLVTFDATGIISAANSFCNIPVLNRGGGLCTARFYPVDTNGRRIFQNCGDIQVTANDYMGSPSGLTVLDVAVNRDGTYDIHFTLSSSIAWDPSHALTFTISMNNGTIPLTTMYISALTSAVSEGTIVGGGSTTATLGEEAYFTLSEIPFTNFLHSSIQAVVVNIKNPSQWVVCSTDNSSGGSSPIFFRYTIPLRFDPGIYKLFVRANDKTMSNRPEITVSGGLSSVVSLYTPVRGSSNLTLHTDTNGGGGSWAFNSGSDYQEIHYTLPIAQVQQTDCVVEITMAPLFNASYAPAGVFEMWDQAWSSAGSTSAISLNTVGQQLLARQASGQASVQWTTPSALNYPASDFVCDLNDFASMLWLSMQEDAGSNQWVTHAWQAGKYIGANSWIPAAGLLPKYGARFSFMMQAPQSGTSPTSQNENRDFFLRLKNLGMFTQGDLPRLTPDNGTDFDFSTDQAVMQAYLNLSGISGSYDKVEWQPDGLIVNMEFPGDFMIVQQPGTTQYGHRIAIYEFAFNQAITPTAVAQIFFHDGVYISLNGGNSTWKYPGATVIGPPNSFPSSMDMSPGVVNTVTVVTGVGSLTIFENGKYTNTITLVNDSPGGQPWHFVAAQCSVTWRKLRIWPPLVKQATPAPIP